MLYTIPTKLFAIKKKRDGSDERIYFDIFIYFAWQGQ
jgi:hypothetical protein